MMKQGLHLMRKEKIQAPKESWNAGKNHSQKGAVNFLLIHRNSVVFGTLCLICLLLKEVQMKRKKNFDYFVVDLVSELNAFLCLQFHSTS